MKSAKKLGRITGLLYLIIFFANMYAYFFVSDTLIVPGDAAATANNIMASEALFRSGLVSYLIVFLSDIGVAVLLYFLLRSVSNIISLTAMMTRLAQIIIHGLNLINFVFPLLLLSGAGYLAVFNSEQLHALVLLFLEGHYYGVLISEAFFAVSTLLVAYLVYKSEYFPRLLGILLVFPALAYFLDSFGIFLLPNYEAFIAEVIILPTVIGEMSFTLYLLIKGVRDPQPTEEGSIEAAPVESAAV